MVDDDDSIAVGLGIPSVKLIEMRPCVCGLTASSYIISKVDILTESSPAKSLTGIWQMQKFQCSLYRRDREFVLLIDTSLWYTVEHIGISVFDFSI